ncbi:MAG: hypothetical protein KC516_02115 [Nanoarchaeota archaeon]|nr:hypothetical protein [Nanoarchaeota archaeon]
MLELVVFSFFIVGLSILAFPALNIRVFFEGTSNEKIERIKGFAWVGALICLVSAYLSMYLFEVLLRSDFSLPESVIVQVLVFSFIGALISFFASKLKWQAVLIQASLFIFMIILVLSFHSIG